MTYIKENWREKEERGVSAKRHTKEMDIFYYKKTGSSVRNTKIHSVTQPCYEGATGELNICISDADSVNAIFEFENDSTAVLNFASYKEPGGMFLEGSRAQEECLCHASNLYNVLRHFEDDFYSWNNDNKNHALYLDRALYTPGIQFISDEGQATECDVITCAAPNKSAAQQYCHITDQENADALDKRIKFVLSVAEEHGVKTLILGAYGCGVFGQDPKEVAESFKRNLKAAPWGFDRVVFAIPQGTNGNYDAFINVFDGLSRDLFDGPETETEDTYFVVEAVTQENRKYVSRFFPKRFPYTRKLINAKHFVCRDSAEKFIYDINEHGKDLIKNAKIKEVSRKLKIR